MIKKTIEERFWTKVNKDGPTQSHMTDPCWMWTAYKGHQGYGRFSLDKRLVLSHRYAYHMAVSPILCSSLCVLHKCDNPSCVRASHLFLGTNADNVQDRVDKGRTNKLHGTLTHLSKLTDKQVLKIRTYKPWPVGPKQSELGIKYNVSQTVISCIVLRKTWKHL